MAAPALSPPPINSPIVQANSRADPVWQRWLAQLQSILAGALHPTTPALVQQTGAVYQGSGVPVNAQGNNGDVYFRTDTPGTANQRLYIRSAGAWVGIL